ncbi:transcriptional regulator of acetoin/glycerol metabolism [Rhodococcus erythropolis]|uniref:sigma-54-dependent Fis family transcriptional regulator n=1 Tax=Rhodococcus erythropolis TaxID=1833 RepID=UPI002169A34F|nr:helix-turn-helix domain-containing protein [Rhodococcus erythropolis]MCS4255700.1 transcriptional regulator of acetoin/glycerol metabolism [Rhodococcus erythropolis]MCW2425213.1 transcriptional regulator of acetoin/glycerol metabolism [Rhodococcus erythropolis]
MGSSPTRPVIVQSWQRVAMSGLDPGVPVDNFRVEDVDRRSRLIVAAAPVLDDLAQELENTGFSVVLADRFARLVDLRFGNREVRTRMERLGSVRGRRFREEDTGTNSIATTFELRSGVAVHGDEHFIDKLKGLSCYGHPILHPVTKRLEGVLDITCLAADDTSLLAPFLVRAVRQIEERLLAGAREAERRILAGFQTAVQRYRGRPVVALGEGVLLANTAAVDLLDSADHAVLRGMAVDAPARSHLNLSSGQAVLVATEKTADGSVFTLEPMAHRPVSTAQRIASTPVLVHGEPGSGRTTAVRSMIGSEYVSMDAADIADHGESSWVSRLDGLLTASSTVVIEAVHLLPESVARQVARGLRSARAGIVLTCGPLAELRGEHVGLVSQCLERIELAPLRNRRDEIPALTRSMLVNLAAPRELRFTPGALESLAGQPWPGNLRELESVTRWVMKTRVIGDVTVQDLPESYRGRAHCRTLTPIEQAERNAIVEALRLTKGNKKDAAKHLGISRTTLYNAIRTLGIFAPVSRI